MKISYNWLKSYLQTELSPEEIGEILTATGLETESIEKFETIRGGLEGILVGEVLTKEKHPEADRLSLTTVSVGLDSPLRIVCGASNVAAGQKVLVATVGCTLYPATGDPIKIKKSKIRGAESEGMICAEDEIGLGNSHEGILILDPSSVPGTPAKELFKNYSDFIFEIGLTPNRSDAMSHIGVARDLKAYLNFHKKDSHTLQLPDVNEPVAANSHNLKIAIEDSIRCPRYSGAVIENIQIAPSPEWLQNRLKSIGLKPINNVVDITNFVMHETSNPLHCFDLEKVGSEIQVRTAKKGEKLKTLDAVDRSLSETDLVICNKDVPMCIAGVMGGIDSGISENTKNIFLEAAYFNPSSVRKTSKLHALHTDSSFRFERGADPNNVLFARNRAISLILEICGGKLNLLSDVYPSPILPVKIEFNFQACRNLCGADFTNEQIVSILKALEYGVSEIKNDTALISVPTYRHDVIRQADLSEEVLRIYGFNNVGIPEKLNSSITLRDKKDREKLYNLTANLLVDSGFFEIMNNSLTSSSFANSKLKYLRPDEFVTILNPLSNELDVLRQSMISGGLSVIEYNQNRQRPDIKIFEFGKVYSRINGTYSEKTKLAIFISGDRRDENWTDAVKKSDFYTLKSVVTKILTRLGLESSSQEVSYQNEALADAISIEINKKSVGFLGWINSQLTKEFGIKKPVFYAELDWDVVLQLVSNKTEFVPLPKTQFVRRDFSLLLDNHIRFSDIESAALSVDKKLLKEVGLFDVYEGKNLPAGKKSYAVSFTFQDPEKTLNDDQIDKMMNSIRQKLESDLKAELR